jgi:hypothetical protein
MDYSRMKSLFFLTHSAPDLSRRHQGGLEQTTPGWTWTDDTRVDLSRRYQGGLEQTTPGWTCGLANFPHPWSLQFHKSMFYLKFIHFVSLQLCHVWINSKSYPLMWMFLCFWVLKAGFFSPGLSWFCQHCMAVDEPATQQKSHYSAKKN